ncbi:ACT domain-containing protein [Lentzea sp. JNUCC 0626]|uniref:ACT domain-containing protein n=1 Tax=Lentzea sp. JNUCC 0626 TaxID=3367513 RepID=UPI003749B244
MHEHLICLTAADDHRALARLSAMLVQRKATITTMQFSRQPDSKSWWIQLIVRVESERERELVVKRLNRLVDIIKAFEVPGDGGHWRQTVFVALHPEPGEAVYIGQIAGSFGAEVLESDAAGIRLHLSADPRRCRDFIDLLRPFGLGEVLLGAVSGVRVGSHHRGNKTRRRATDTAHTHRQRN